VPVSSDLFGDPCPETHKYVEIHYTCSPAEDNLQHRPPWYIHPSLNSSSLLPPLPHPWLKDDVRSDLPPAKSGGAAAPRIPILVATTTSTPKRIPITSSPPPTTTTTTLKTTAPLSIVTTTSRNSDKTQHSDKEELIVEDEGDLGDEENDLKAEEEEQAEEEEGNEGLVESSLVDMREQQEEEGEEEGELCRPSLSRNLYWKQTPWGEAHVQPCPNGATGTARWLCSHHQVQYLGEMKSLIWDLNRETLLKFLAENLVSNFII